ncbi:GNAT family N-acetyltransferase [Bacillus sp. FJAT-49736]|uniref:GNAT family N-acetyltransferase n=1 Tax=Bacillus sp. FJAT-49736 TaxID=2833582 RepID=UPI001BC9BE5D|nr:GNAT family N-acetyltransferase [Bacillus sp. FJAT-49736]MBS4174424.1 GNAT family N-acetyltransferase [Bacillus sp. FJAT-49736]
MISFVIKKYEPDFHSEVVKLYQALKEKYEDVVYWWPGKEPFTWNFCDCVFVGEQLVGKGQVQPIAVMEEGSNPDFQHKIYLNIKIHPDYEKEAEIYESIYNSLYNKALQIRESLPKGFDSLLCVGNFKEEVKNNEFFLSQGFKPLNSLFGMTRDLLEEIDSVEKPSEFEVDHWKIDREEEQLQYLKAEAEIWPENPLGLERLQQFKSNPNWTAITAFHNGEIAGSIMAWEESGEKVGVIEDVFVKETHRKKGLARYLLTEGLKYLQGLELKEAQLEVVTDNYNALNLYRSVGFKEVLEEKRFFIQL